VTKQTAELAATLAAMERHASLASVLNVRQTAKVRSVAMMGAVAPAGHARAVKCAKSANASRASQIARRKHVGMMAVEDPAGTVTLQPCASAGTVRRSVSRIALEHFVEMPIAVGENVTAPVRAGESVRTAFVLGIASQIVLAASVATMAVVAVVVSAIGRRRVVRVDSANALHFVLSRDANVAPMAVVAVAAVARVKTVATTECASRAPVRRTVPGRNAVPMDVRVPAGRADRTSTAMAAFASLSAGMVTASVERRVRRALGTAARAARTGRATTEKPRRRARRIAPGSANQASAPGRRRTGRTVWCGWRFRRGAS